MNEILLGIGFGLAVGIAVLMCFGVLIGIGQIIEWFEKK